MATHQSALCIEFAADLVSIRVPLVQELRQIGIGRFGQHDGERQVLIPRWLVFRLFTPLPFRRNLLPEFEPLGMRMVTGPSMVGTSIRAPSTAS